MLNLITGKQRSGKSYFTVTLIIDYLRQTNRPIYTNLPINPDIIADLACHGRLRFPALYLQYLSRIHIFVNYSGRNRQSFSTFKKLNPDFCKLYHSMYGKADDYRHHLFIPCGNDNFIIRQFWRYTLSNSVIFFDEVYEIFGALDQLSKGRDLRKELLSYSKQHGHFKDDLFLITHDPADIDKIIRKSLNKQFVVVNSKYQNISNHRFFKGLRWPIQFFIVRGYEYGERESQDQFNVFPRKEIFSCYNSFNVSDMLDKEMALEEDTSSDTAVNHKSNFRNFIKQAFPLILLSASLVSGFIAFLYLGIKYFSSQSSGSVSVEKTSSVKKTEIPSLSETESIFVKLITPDCIIYSDGSRKVKGDFIYGCQIVEIQKNFVVVTYRGKRCRLSLSALRRSASSSVANPSTGKNDQSFSSRGATSSGSNRDIRYSDRSRSYSAIKRAGE